MSAVAKETEPAPSQKSRRWLRWVGYVAGGLASLLLVLACIGAVYEGLERNRDRRLNRPPGLLVDVGGYRMHIYCIGQGSPTVVLDSGLGDYWLSWYKVQPAIAQYARVCAYDRAGLGWSDPSPQPRTSRVFAEELHTLLYKAAVPGPYVLAGHSLGGLNTRMYASLYPADVVGMVLVDSSHPDQGRRFPPELKTLAAEFYRKLDRARYTMPFGIPRLMGWCGTDPPELRSMVRAVECQVKPFREIHAEWATVDESAAQVRATGSLGNMPLVVLSRDPDRAEPGLPASVAKPMNQAWEQMQEELTHLSSNRARVIAKGSGHYIQIDRPDLVIEAVDKVVQQCRKPQAGSWQR